MGGFRRLPLALCVWSCRGSRSGVVRISRPANAIAARGLVMLASRPHRALRAAMVALLLTDQADRVRATRSVASARAGRWRTRG